MGKTNYCARERQIYTSTHKEVAQYTPHKSIGVSCGELDIIFVKVASTLNAGKKYQYEL